MTDKMTLILLEIRRRLDASRNDLNRALNSIELNVDDDEIVEDDTETIALIEEIGDLCIGLLKLRDDISRITKEY